MAKVTLQQIADYAQVSRRTVDRVIHHKGNVKPESAERVREAIRLLGYERNKAASALASSQYAKRVCIIYGKSASAYYDDKAMNGIRQAEKELNEFGIEVNRVVIDSQNAETFRAKLEAIGKDDYCGLAIRAPYNAGVVESINRITERGIPVVTFNSDIPSSKRTCYVGEDLYRSGRIAGNIMSHLVRDGEKILIGCGFPDFYAHTARIDGFIKEINQSGISKENLIFLHTDQEYETTCEGLKDSFDKNADIRGIYMSVEPNAACADFLKSAGLKMKPYVVCHDLDQNTVNYLRDGLFDFVIDQDIAAQYERALLYLRDNICFGLSHDTIYSTSHIYSAAFFE